MNQGYNLNAGFLFLYDWMPVLERLSGEDFKALFSALIARQRENVPLPTFENDLAEIFARMIEPTIQRRLNGQMNAKKGQKKSR